MNLNYENISGFNLIEKLDKKIIMDLINVRSTSISDSNIVLKWMKDYTNRGVPFIISHTPKERADGVVIDWTTLWVEETAPPDFNYSIPRNEIVFNLDKFKKIGEK